MNPVIVIPTYWTDQEGRVGAYDHATPVDAPEPELARCLDSLEQVRGVMRTVVLVSAPPEARVAAAERVRALCAEHPHLSPLVVAEREARVLQDAVAALAPRLPGEAVSLRGYGAIRNLGLTVAAVLGHDVVVFLDDDELALSPDFLVEGVYGLGRLTRQGIPVLAKSGCFIDPEGSVLANERLPWHDRKWDKNLGFNQWMRRAQDATRISRSSHLCGGCFAVRAEAFTQVAFDPFITRGEDLDYLFNLRLYGFDVWFDNQWRVLHDPPSTPDPANRFRQNVFRWVYERRKLQVASARPDLVQVTPSSLQPYPGAYLEEGLDRRIRSTALRRALTTRDRMAYLGLWRSGLQEAHANAQRHERSYLSLQSWWPSIMAGLWENPDVAAWLLAAGEVAPKGAAPSNDQGTGVWDAEAAQPAQTPEDDLAPEPAGSRG